MEQLERERRRIDELERNPDVPVIQVVSWKQRFKNAALNLCDKVDEMCQTVLATQRPADAEACIARVRQAAAAIPDFDSENPKLQNLNHQAVVGRIEDLLTALSSDKKLFREVGGDFGLGALRGQTNNYRARITEIRGIVQDLP
jgi:hypothetical protein